MVNEVVARAGTAVSQAAGAEEDNGSTAPRRRGVRSQRRLVELIEAGDADAAEDHWRTHMTVLALVMLGQTAPTAVQLMDHFCRWSRSRLIGSATPSSRPRAPPPPGSAHAHSTPTPPT